MFYGCVVVVTRIRVLFVCVWFGFMAVGVLLVRIHGCWCVIGSDLGLFVCDVAGN